MSQDKAALTEGSIISAANNNGFASAGSRMSLEGVEKFNEKKRYKFPIFEQPLRHELHIFML